MNIYLFIGFLLLAFGFWLLALRGSNKAIDLVYVVVLVSLATIAGIFACLTLLNIVLSP